MAAVREYHEAMGERVTLAWTLSAGVNTRPDEARRLAELTAGMPVQHRLDRCERRRRGNSTPPSDAERRRSAMR